MRVVFLVLHEETFIVLFSSDRLGRALFLWIDDSVLPDFASSRVADVSLTWVEGLRVFAVAEDLIKVPVGKVVINTTVASGAASDRWALWSGFVSDFLWILASWALFVWTLAVVSWAAVLVSGS